MAVLQSPNPAPIDQASYQRAPAHERLAVRLAAVHGLLSVLLALAASLLPSTAATPVLWLDAAACAIVATAAWVARVPALWRRRRAGLSGLAVPSQSAATRWRWLLAVLVRGKQDRPEHAPLPFRLLKLWLLRTRRTVHRRVGRQVEAILGGAMPALVLAAWPCVAPFGSASGPTLLAVGLSGVLAAFSWLVLERQLQLAWRSEWPEASALAQLLRATLLAVLAGSTALLAASAGFLPARWLIRLAALWLILFEAELTGRALVACFLPYSRRLEPKPLLDSRLAGLLQWPPGGTSLRAGLPALELRQSWAFAFIRQLAAPLACALLLAGWLLSSVSAVGIDQRGVYERFGSPQAVYGPGLHLGLPWPFGRMRLVENGVVHQLATGLVQDKAGGWQAAPENAQDGTSAEAFAPHEADRLWDVSHRAETVQLLAGPGATAQSVQLVSLDIRLVYRIGLRDRAALAVLYHDADLSARLRSSANHALLHYFAGRTLDALLGDQLARVSRELRSIIQADLDRQGSGIELLAVVVETLHPPAGAAHAYHAVQAAELATQAQIAAERGRAVTAMAQASQIATQARDEAQANAADERAAAQAGAITFEAERQASRSAGPAFQYERRLEKLAQGLNGARAVIVDHRIAGTGMPTVDLRPNPSPGDLAGTAKSR
jgi:regulator of protease activity HflC (stomatin/prohibitin superfamily)